MIFNFKNKKNDVPQDCLIMVSVVDTVAEKYGVPVTIDNEKSAIRAFRDMVRNKSGIIGAHPSDFSLVVVGYFDQKTGNIYSPKNSKSNVLISGFEAQSLNEFENVPEVNSNVEKKGNENVLHEVQPSA